MKRYSVAMLFLLPALLLFIGQPARVNAQEQPPADGTVYAVLFWLSTCPHCHDVIENVLPPLEARYGSQVQIYRAEVSGAENWANLQALAASQGIPAEYVGVPFLVIGDTFLIGSDRIEMELPGLIEAYLAQGGVALPALYGLESLIGVETNVTSAPVVTQPSGYGLAIGLLVLMALAVGISGVMLIRGQRPTQKLAQISLLVPVLALIGLGVSGYLAFVEVQQVEAICGPVGDCNTVQQSPYARLFGLIPIGVVGVFGYALLLGLAIWGWRDESQAKQAAPLIFGLSLGGTLFSIYLTYLEPFVIGAVCMWCLSSAVIITLLMLATLGPTLNALAPAHTPRGRQRKAV
jgi:uncharacterized membrane protein